MDHHPHHCHYHHDDHVTSSILAIQTE